MYFQMTTKYSLYLSKIKRLSVEKASLSLALALVTSSLLLTQMSCGSTTATPSTAPTISNLSFSPSSASQNQGGGAVTFTGTINFIDPEGDIQTIYLSTSGGTVSATLTGVSGATTGTVYVTTAKSTTTKGTYPFSIYVKDSRGNQSNSLSGSVVIN